MGELLLNPLGLRKQFECKSLVPRSVPESGRPLQRMRVPEVSFASGLFLSCDPSRLG